MRVKESKGAILIILAFVIMVGLTGVLVAFMTMISHEMRSARLGLRNIQAFYIAEAGRAKARWALTTGGQTAGWNETDALEEGTYTFTTADNGNGTCTISSDGYIPNATNPIAKRRVIENNIPITAGTNLSLNVTISASSEKLPSNPKENANDGIDGSSWKANSQGDAWLELDFESSTTFDKAIYTGNNINSCTIEYSNNAVDYYPVTNAVESPAGTVNFDSVSARYLKFSMDVDSKKTAETNELETYNTAMGGFGQGTFSTSW